MKETEQREKLVEQNKRAEVVYDMHSIENSSKKLGLLFPTHPQLSKC